MKHEKPMVPVLLRIPEDMLKDLKLAFKHHLKKSKLKVSFSHYLRKLLIDALR